MTIIDTHAHIYDENFLTDLPAVVEQCLQANVTEVLMPNCDSSTIDAMMLCAQQFPKVCKPMMGLHPCYVKADWQVELKKIEASLLQNLPQFCAIGEIGLDYHWDTTFVNEQIAALHLQIEWALAHDLPIVIHSRESTPDCIKIVSQYIPKGLKGAFHCFSGTLEEAMQLVDIGFYLGIGGVLTYKKSGLDLIVQNVPISNIVLETDAPYLAPVPHRGKKNHPAYTAIVAQALADILQVPLNEVTEKTTYNAKRLFKLF
jgi:TatD DNase family protein